MSHLEMPNYMIHFGQADQLLLELIPREQYSKLLILLDTNTSRDCLPLISKKLDQYPSVQFITIDPGEQYKTIETCQQIWQELLQTNTDRKALMINLGGGVIGDMGGFAASTYKRGIDFIQIPTTLLSQVDASVGGKLGVDFNKLKNVIGLFRDPKAVIIDHRFFQTLEEKELLSGWAEMLKHALIDSKAHWESLQALDPLQIATHSDSVQNSITVKQRVVLEDPFEAGSRKMLNFGHTYGHAYEALEHSRTQNPATHGASVAQGMMIALALSVGKCGFDHEQAKLIIRKLHEWYTYDPIVAPEQIQLLLQFMQNDKKNESKELRFCLIEEIGKVQLSVPVAFDEVLEAMNTVKTMLHADE